MKQDAASNLTYERLGVEKMVEVTQEQVGKENEELDDKYVDACQMLNKGEHAKGLVLLTVLAERLPNNINVVIKKLEANVNLGNLGEAQAILSELQSDYGNDRRVVQAAPIVKFHSGDFQGAYRSTLELSEEERSQKQFQEIIKKSILEVSSPDLFCSIEQDLSHLLTMGQIKEDEFYKVGQRVILQKLNALGSQSHKLEGFAKDEFFINVLESGFVRSMHLEQLVTTIRSKILTVSLSQMDMPDSLVRLSIALSIQAANNEYVHYISPQEEAIIKELEAALQGVVSTTEWQPEDAEGLFLLLSMYQSLYDLPVRDQLLERPIEQWPESLKGLVRLNLYDIANEVKRSSGIRSIGVLESEVSRKVQAQYEEHPYPRWHNLFDANVRMTYGNYILRSVLGCPVKPYEGKGGYEVLIAGCGTGKHPITLAKIITNKITGVDLSRRSLAYAQISAEKHHVENVDFVQLDLLNVESLGKKFDAVECMGVLHHMEDPEQGLRALLQVIKPGGFLKLGLYSELARTEITKLRQMFIKSGMQATNENIRAIRNAVLSSEATRNTFEGICNLPDFYSMSACRDMLFHVQEHCYTIDKLRKLLAKYDLRFLGFSGLPLSIVGQFEDEFGSENYLNLDAWEAFEKKHPDTFICMYQFMTQTNS